MRCPKCQSENTKMVAITSRDWSLGAQLCLDCGHQAHWTQFCEDLPDSLKVTSHGGRPTP